MTGAGLITGMPTQVNTEGFAGSVTITDHSTPPQTVTGIPLVIAVFPQPLTITTSALPAGVQGATYSQPIQVVGGVPPYSWSLFRSSLSGTGLTLDGTTGNVKGSPAASGPISFRVQVTDQQQTPAYQNITLQIYPQLIISTAAMLPFALTGQAYSVQLSTQPGTGAPGTIDLVRGSRHIAAGAHAGPDRSAARDPDRDRSVFVRNPGQRRNFARSA